MGPLHCGPALLWGDLALIPVKDLAQRRGLGLDSRDKDPTIHFRFDLARPGLGFGIKGFVLPVVATPDDLRLPGGTTARTRPFAECRHACPPFFAIRVMAGLRHFRGCGR
ncbi:MAG: hypothetical protein ACYCTF_06065 [Acidiferrobacter sp.]